MPKNDKRPIIIKRDSGDDSHGHHGGAWKIAYADFMTAMMAFFLVMWLLNATTDEQRRGIAQFFNPMADKDAHLRPTDSMLEAHPSPMTQGEALHRVKDGETPKKPTDEQSGPTSAPHSLPRSPNEDDITYGIRRPLTPSSPAIVPIGGPESGAARSTGYVGTENQVEAASEQAKLEQTAQGLQKAIAQNPDTQPASGNMSVRIGRDDIRIELHDASNAPMFDTGSAAPNKVGRKMLAEIAAWLAPLPENISIIGHTDADPYHAGKHWRMSNWTLSALRADYAREALVKAGYPDRKILDVTGLADSDLAMPEDPTAAGNRRVVIILHKRFTNPVTQPAPAAAPAPAQPAADTTSATPAQ